MVVVVAVMVVQVVVMVVGIVVVMVFRIGGSCGCNLTAVVEKVVVAAKSLGW